jgi:outer membrane receptor for monomeric catechols
MKVQDILMVVLVLSLNNVLSTICLASDEGGKAAGVSSASVVAAVPTSQAAPLQKTDASAIAKTNAAVTTGSYVSDKTKRTGRITDGALNVTVLDRDEIEHSGSATLAQILSKEPGITVRRR